MVASRGITCEACDRTAQGNQQCEQNTTSNLPSRCPTKGSNDGFNSLEFKTPLFHQFFALGPLDESSNPGLGLPSSLSAIRTAPQQQTVLSGPTRTSVKRRVKKKTKSQSHLLRLPPLHTTNRPHELRATATAKMSFMISHQTSEFAHDVNAAAGAWGPSTSRAKYVIPPSPSLPD